MVLCVLYDFQLWVLQLLSQLYGPAQIWLGLGQFALVFVKQPYIPAGDCLTIFIANFLPLGALATMGSAGFLFIFMAVNWANVVLHRETSSPRWISLLGAGCCGAAIILLCMEVDENPATENQLWIVSGTILLSFVIEIVYRHWRR